MAQHLSMPPISLLLLLFVLDAHAKQMKGSLGHWAPGMTPQAADCQYTVILSGSASCTQVADAQQMSLAAFENLNRWLDCTATLNTGTVVCVADGGVGIQGAAGSQGLDGTSSGGLATSTGNGEAAISASLQISTAATATLNATSIITSMTTPTTT
ncbi:hypothetical protein BC830DRAFT_1174967, partial [Chytriomyces sp. MP71]